MLHSGDFLSRGVAEESGHGSAEGGERPRQAVKSLAGRLNEAREDAPECGRRFTRHYLPSAIESVYSSQLRIPSGVLSRLAP